MTTHLYDLILKCLQWVQCLSVCFSHWVKWPLYIVLCQSWWLWRNNMTGLLRQEKACSVTNLFFFFSPQVSQRRCPEHLFWWLPAWLTVFVPSWRREEWLGATGKSSLIKLIPLSLPTSIRLVKFQKEGPLLVYVTGSPCFPSLAENIHSTPPDTCA